MPGDISLKITDFSGELPMDIEDAMTETIEGVIISLDVSAGSKKTVFPFGYNEWRKAFLCRIDAPPVEGRANKEIVSALAEFFSVSKSDVSIISGATSSMKRVLVTGIKQNDASALLLKSLKD